MKCPKCGGTMKIMHPDEGDDYYECRGNDPNCWHIEEIK
jgi:ssDNA-binding Zn-finger/Zn-ribbon topoisomerase 1